MAKVEAVELSEKSAWLAEIEDTNLSLWLQDTMYLLQSRIVARQVAKAESGYNQVQTVFLNGKMKGIGFDRLNFPILKLCQAVMQHLVGKIQRVDSRIIAQGA